MDERANLQSSAGAALLVENLQARLGSASQDGGGNELNLGNSFRSDGFARMSSDEFERASDDNDDNQNAAMQIESSEAGGDQIRPVLATSEKTLCYSLFENHQVRVEGPEFNRDFTYYLVDKMPDLKNFEQGIGLE